MQPSRIGTVVVVVGVLTCGQILVAPTTAFTVTTHTLQSSVSFGPRHFDNSCPTPTTRISPLYGIRTFIQKRFGGGSDDEKKDSAEEGEKADDDTVPYTVVVDPSSSTSTSAVKKSRFGSPEIQQGTSIAPPPPKKNRDNPPFS